jgi:hypothetical protein
MESPSSALIHIYRQTRESPLDRDQNCLTVAFLRIWPAGWFQMRAVATSPRLILRAALQQSTIRHRL